MESLFRKVFVGLKKCYWEGASLGICHFAYSKIAIKETCVALLLEKGSIYCPEVEHMSMTGNNVKKEELQGGFRNWQEFIFVPHLV